MCQNLGNNIRHWRCDYRRFERRMGKDVDSLRRPVFGPIRVHGKDEKNPLVWITPLLGSPRHSVMRSRLKFTEADRPQDLRYLTTWSSPSDQLSRLLSEPRQGLHGCNRRSCIRPLSPYHLPVHMSRHNTREATSTRMGIVIENLLSV